MIALIRAAVGARRHLLRHRRGLRSVHQRGVGRRGAGAVPRTVVIATKFGHDSATSSRRPRQPARTHPAIVEGSLKRLRVESIDLSTSTGSTPNVPIEDVAGAVKDLIAQARSSISACRSRAPRPSAAPTPFSPSRPSRANTRSGGARRRRTSCRPARRLGSASSPSARWAGAS